MEAATATHDLWNAPDLVQAITYSDLSHAIEWLERVFGFRERAEARLTWPGGGITWIEVGNGLFSIATPNEVWGQDSSTATPGVVMKVYVDDIDRHFSRAKAEGARIISEPEEGFSELCRLKLATLRRESRMRSSLQHWVTFESDHSPWPSNLALQLPGFGVTPLAMVILGNILRLGARRGHAVLPSGEFLGRWATRRGV